MKKQATNMGDEYEDHDEIDDEEVCSMHTYQS